MKVSQRGDLQAGGSADLRTNLLPRAPSEPCGAQIGQKVVLDLHSPGQSIPSISITRTTWSLKVIVDGML